MLPGLSVSLSVTIVSPAKPAEPIEVPFGMWTRVGRRNHVIDGVQIPKSMKGNFEGTVDILKATQQGVEPVRRGRRLGCIKWGVHWRHLVNTTEPSVCLGDVALCQISFGSRPSNHYFRSVCWFVCLSVCLCRVFLSRL